jgi:hypothetical protein|tara:strand:- start:1848 stop:2147 length:300 start_codon:yes stop_codon:yes gene_type:complete
MIYDIKVVGTNASTKHLDGCVEFGVDFFGGVGGGQAPNTGVIAIVTLANQEYCLADCNVVFLNEGITVSGILASENLVGRISLYLTNPRKKDLDETVNA